MKNLVLVFYFLCFGNMRSQNNIHDASIQRNQIPILFTKSLKLDILLLDMPYQKDAIQTLQGNFFNAFSNLSMQQSVRITNNLNNIYDYSTNWLIDQTATFLYNKCDIPATVSYILLYTSSAFIRPLLYSLPGFENWLNYEGIKSVGTVYGVDMQNPLASFSPKHYSVFNIEDRSLEQMNVKYPQSFIRMHSAGNEAINMSIKNNKNYFFRTKLSNANIVQMILNGSVSLISNILLFQPNQDYFSLDNKIDELNKIENAISSRTLGGPNILVNWVYELFNQHGNYNDRGVHPSENGINRYIKYARLSNDEKQYLNKTNNLWWTRLISPFSVGIQSIKLGKKWEGNFALMPWYTSFGTDITLDIYLKKHHYKYLTTFHYYENYENNFYALEFSFIDKIIVNKSNFKTYYTANVLIGKQPSNQGFKTTLSQTIFKTEHQFSFALGKQYWILPYINIGYKTSGWIAGNPYLEEQFYSHTGCYIGL